MVKVEVFSGPQCAYCEQAKALLEQRGISYLDYDISEDEHLQELRSRLPRVKSIPQIFIKGEHIGNDEDLKIFAANARLEALLD